MTPLSQTEETVLTELHPILVPLPEHLRADIPVRALRRELLHLHPAQKFLCDPQRGRQYRHMANRWVSCTKEPPVSQISDQAVEFAFKLAPVESITAVNGEVCCNVTAGNKWMLHPGDYRIRLK